MRREAVSAMMQDTQMPGRVDEASAAGRWMTASELARARSTPPSMPPAASQRLAALYTLVVRPWISE